MAVILRQIRIPMLIEAGNCIWYETSLQCGACY